MAQAIQASSPQITSVQQAAAAIVALIHSSPRSPRQEEIAAIIAKAMPPAIGGDYAIVRRWEAAEAAHYAVAVRNEEASNTEHGSANDILIAETKRMWRAPVTGWPDVVARANAARYWKWPRFDGNEARKYETLVREADDLDDGPLALLIHAILTIEEAHSPRVPAAPQEAPISDLRIRLRKAIARYDKALAVAAKTMGPEFKRAEAEQVAAGEEIAALEAEIPHPPRCYEDLYARAEVARHGGDVVDGKLMEAEDEEDVFLGPAGRLIEAVVHMGGRRS